MNLASFLSLFAFLALFGTSLPAREADLGKVSRTVAQVFSEGHYSQHPMDAEIAQRCLVAYLDRLDPDHLFFTQEDLQQITPKASLARDAAAGNLKSARLIFELYKKRVQQRHRKVDEFLRKGSFDFTSDREVELVREEAPWPKDEAQADALWRDQIEGDLLDAKLDGESLKESILSARERFDRLEREVESHSMNATMADLLSALAHAYDPHSEYLRKQDFDALNADMRLSMVGIGITIEADGRLVKIKEVYPSSPAGVDGRLKPNDRILAVAHGDGGFVKVEGKSFDQVVELIHARKGTRIQLRVKQPGHSASRVVDLVSRTIELTDEQAKAEVVERNLAPENTHSPTASADSSPAPDKPSHSLRLGWLRIPSFYGDPTHPKVKSVSKDVRQLLKKLDGEHLSGLVLDLRNNPGGELDEAVKIGGFFMGKVPVVQEKDSDGSLYISKANTPVLYQGPMVVLIDHLTASAAELLAAALQDHHRALIVGGCYSSFGKGTVQTVLELGDLMPELPRGDSFGAIQLTIAKFYRVNGASTQLKGITSDIALPSPEDLPGEGESSMKFPLPYDEAAPVAEIAKLSLDQPSAARWSQLTSRLALLSKNRVQADPEFRYLLEDLQRAKAGFNRVSLNESRRLKQLEEEKQLLEARASERAARKSPQEQVRSISPQPAQAGSPKSIRRKAQKEEKQETQGIEPDPVRQETLNILQDLAVRL